VNPFPLSGIGRGAVVNRGRFMVSWCRCVIYRGGLVVDRLWFMVNWLRFMVDRFWLMIGRLWFMVCRRWRMIGLLLWIVSSSLIGHLSLIPIVVVSSVLDMLDAAIRKLDRVGAAHNIAIRCLSSPKVGLAVIIGHSILISVGLWGVFFLMINRFWLMVDRFWFMVNRLWFMVHRFWCMVHRFGFVVHRFGFVVHRLWCMVDWFWWGIGRFWWRVDRLWDMVGGGGGVVDRRWGRVIHWSRGMVGGGGMNSGMVHWDIVVAEAGVTV